MAAPNIVGVVTKASSGVAPLFVHVDLSGTTNAGVTTDPFHELLYVIDWGDPSGPGFVNRPAVNANLHFGPQGAHVYETPANYTITVTVINKDLESAVWTSSVTVNAFSGTDYHFAIGGNDANPGTQASPKLTWAHARSLWGDNVRILWNRGDTFTITEDGATNSCGTVTTTGPFVMGAYGAGNKPILDVDTNLQFLNVSSADDARFVDLDLDGEDGVGGPSSRRCFNGAGQNSLFFRCDCDGFADGVIQSGGTPRDGVGVIDCIFANMINYDIFFNAVTTGRNPWYAGLLANVFGAVDDEHQIRVYLSKAVIAYNDFSSGLVGGKVQLRLLGNDAAQKTEFVQISDNTHPDPGTGSQTMNQIGSQNDTSERHLENIIIERNRYTSTTINNTKWAMELRAGTVASDIKKVTIRNNVFDGMVHAFRATSGQRDEFWVYNNIHIRTVTGAGQFIVGDGGTNGTFTKLYLWNNIAYFPNLDHSTAQHFLSLPSAQVLSEITESNNLIHIPNAPSNDLFNIAGTEYTLAEWQALGKGSGTITSVPTFVNEAGADYHPLETSPAVDAGTVVQGALADSDLNERPVGSAHDMGPYEFGATAFAFSGGPLKPYLERRVRGVARYRYRG